MKDRMECSEQGLGRHALAERPVAMVTGLIAGDEERRR